MNKEKLIEDIKKIKKNQVKEYYAYLNKVITENHNQDEDEQLRKYFLRY